MKLVEAASEAALATVLARAIEEIQPFASRLARVHDCFWLRIWLRRETRAVPAVDSIHDILGTAGTH